MLDSTPYDEVNVQNIAPRIIAVITGAIMLKFGFLISSMFPPLGNPLALFTTVVFYGAAFFLMFSATTDLNFEKWGNYVGYGLLGVTLLAVFTAYLSKAGQGVFGTDGILFSRYAVDLLLSGQNPYAHSMEPAFEQYNVASKFVTYKRDASVVTSFSYPSLAFLWFVPQALLGIPNLNYTTVAVLMLTLAYLVHVTPSKYAVAPFAVLFADPSLLLFSFGGVFDILWTLPVLVGMRFWSSDRYMTGAFLFGLAFATKQTPWFIAPFLAIWVYYERDTIREVLLTTRNCAGAGLAGFILPNLPFILWNPIAWANGVLTPVSGGVPLVKQGMGLTMLSVTGITGLPKTFYTITLLLAMTVLLVAYTVYYDRLKWMLWITPAFILWFNYRSLQNYFVFFLPVAYLTVFLSLKHSNTADIPEAVSRKLWTPTRDLDSSSRRRVVAGVGALALGTATGAGAILSRDSELNASVSIVDISDPFGIYRVSEITFDVTNDESTEIEPVFHFIHSEGRTHTYWEIVGGPTVLSPGETAKYVVRPETPSAALPYDSETVIGINDSGTEYGKRLDARSFDAPSQPPKILNESLGHWVTQTRSSISKPYKWNHSKRTTDPSLINFTNNEGSPSISVSGPDPNVNGWTMVGLHQTIVMPNTLTIEATPESVVDEAAKTYPRATGVEISDRDRRVWVVFADIEERTVVHREGKLDYTFVYIPAKPGERISATIDIDSIYSENGWDKPSPETYSLYGSSYMAPRARVLAFAAVYPGTSEGAGITFHSISAE